MGNHDHSRDSSATNEQKAMYFLVCGLYLNNEEIKRRFSEYLDGRSFDRAIQKLRENKELPKWFSELFFYDQLYEILTPLRDLLRLALTYGLIRVDGTNYNYHLDQVTDRIFHSILKEEQLELADVKKFADQLSEEILNPT